MSQKLIPLKPDALETHFRVDMTLGKRFHLRNALPIQRLDATNGYAHLPLFDNSNSRESRDFGYGHIK